MKEELTLDKAELLMIEQLCLEGEFHCARRAAVARRKEDYSSANYENRLKLRYNTLRKKISGVDGAAAPARPPLLQPGAAEHASVPPL